MKKIINSDLVLTIEKRDSMHFKKTFLDVLEQHSQRENSIDIVKLDVGDANVEVIQHFISRLTKMLEDQDVDKNIIFVPVGEKLPVKDIKISRVVVEEVNNVEEDNRKGKTETT